MMTIKQAFLCGKKDRTKRPNLFWGCYYTAQRNVRHAINPLPPPAGEIAVVAYSYSLPKLPLTGLGGNQRNFDMFYLFASLSR
jgi:hypothetical protein